MEFEQVVQNKEVVSDGVSINIKKHIYTNIHK